MGADAASPTAERLTGPSPGSGMDGGVLLCQLAEGVSSVHAGGRVPCFVSARRMERPGICAGLWLPPPKIFETSEEAESCRPCKQDNALVAKKSKF